MSWIGDKLSSAYHTVVGDAAPASTAPAPTAAQVLSTSADKALGAPVAPARLVVDDSKAKPDYISDPTLDPNRAVCDDKLAQKPLVGDDKKWNGAAILSTQTQLNTGERPNAVDPEYRCGPSSVLASAVMQGPDATEHLVDKLGSKVSGDKQKAELAGIHQRLADGTADHNDLSRVQELMYDHYRDPDGSNGVSSQAVQQMESDLLDKSTAPALGGSDGGNRLVINDGRTVEGPKLTQSHAASLAPGQNFVLNVDPKAQQKDAHHFVLIGKDQDGAQYVYDPYPKSNQPPVVYAKDNPNIFNYYTGGQMGVNIPNGLVNIEAGNTNG